MSLLAFVEAVERQRKTLTVYNPSAEHGESLVAEVAAYFGEQNVAVELERTETGRPADLVVLRQGETFLTAVPVENVLGLLEETPAGPDGLGVDDSEYYDLLRHLKETTFTADGKQRMIAVSREIEDRAWRVGAGQLHAGFQYASIMAGESDTYEALATTGVDIHAYGARDREPPELPGVTIHLEDDGELERTWFVVFDGNGERHNKTALLAEERDPDAFYGFWTYDPNVVDRIVDYLERRYGLVSQ